MLSCPQCTLGQSTFCQNFKELKEGFKELKELFEKLMKSVLDFAQQVKQVNT